MKQSPAIKVCGLNDSSNIEEVISLNPQYIGFIFYPKSARYIGELDAEYVTGLEGVKKTAVFVNASLSAIEIAIVKYQFDAIQLHGNESPELCKRIRESEIIGERRVEIIKAFGVDLEFDFTQLSAYLPIVDYFLFDTKTSKYGGSGQSFNWEVLRQYPYSKPYFLSGGIGPDNFKEAYEFEDERLYALDLNSRFESSPGIKNITLLKQALKK